MAGSGGSGPLNRCARTAALLDAAFSDAELTSLEAAHVAACAECARALALARRFDGELHRVAAELTADPSNGAAAMRQVRPELTGGPNVKRIPTVLAIAAIAAVGLLAVAVTSTVPVGQLQVGGIGADELARWINQARLAAHEADVGGQTEIDDWEPAQVEVCGGTVVAFFEHADDPGIGYRWALGSPGDWLDRSIDTGSSRTLGAPEVAERRAALPVCSIVLAPDVPDAVVGDLEIGPQQVVRVAGLSWIGDPDRAPFEVEVTGRDRDVLGREVGIASEGYIVGRLDDSSIHAVDVVTEEGRYRYTVAAPGFVIHASPDDDQIGYELLDASGSVVTNGSVVDLAWRDVEARRQAEQAAIAQVLAVRERRALETGEDGARCSEWPTMTDLSQLAITEVLVPDLERARILQQLPASASRSDIIVAARASLDNGCQGSPGARALADVARGLFGD